MHSTRVFLFSFPTSDNYLAKSLLKTHTQEVRIFILLSGMKVTFSVDAGSFSLKDLAEKSINIISGIVSFLIDSANYNTRNMPY